MKFILETERLTLRETTLADLDFVAALRAHPEVMRYYPKCYDRDEVEQSIRRQLDQYARYGHSLWLAERKSDRQPIGQIGLIMQTVTGSEEREIGYLVHRPFWRQGFASEAAAACRDHAFATFNAPRVISLIRPVNLPSQGVARKIGLTTDGTIVMHAELEHLVFARDRGDPPR